MDLFGRVVRKKEKEKGREEVQEDQSYVCSFGGVVSRS